MFKKMIKKTAAILTSFALIFSGYSLTAAMQSTFGATTSPVLEMITFQTATAGGSYSNAPKTVAINDTVYFYIEVQNRNPTSIAENTKVKVFLPDYHCCDITTTATVTTTTPSVEPDGRTSDSKSMLTSLNASDLRLIYKTGTTKVTADLNNDGVKEFDNRVMGDEITQAGINLGTLTGGANTVQISFEAQVARAGNPNLTIAHTGANVSKNTGFSDSTNVDPGETVRGYIEIHNTNVPSTANNVVVRIDVPQDRSGAVTSTAFVKADNFAQISDPTVFNVSSGNLKLVSGSAKITWDRDGDGVKEINNQGLPDTIFSSSGLALGNLNGSNPFVIQLSFEAVVQPTGSTTVVTTQAPPTVITNERIVERVVEKPVEKKVVEIREIRELPKSGPEALGLALSAGLIPLGYLLRRFKP